MSCMSRRRNKPLFTPGKAFLLLQLLKGGITDPIDLGHLVGLPPLLIAKAHETELRVLATDNKEAFLLNHPVRCENCGTRLNFVPCTLCANEGLPQTYRLTYE